MPASPHAAGPMRLAGAAGAGTAELAPPSPPSCGSRSRRKRCSGRELWMPRQMRAMSGWRSCGGCSAEAGQPAVGAPAGGLARPPAAVRATQVCSLHCLGSLSCSGAMYLNLAVCKEKDCPHSTSEDAEMRSSCSCLRAGLINPGVERLQDNAVQAAKRSYGSPCNVLNKPVYHLPAARSLGGSCLLETPSAEVAAARGMNFPAGLETHSMLARTRSCMQRSERGRSH